MHKCEHCQREFTNERTVLKHVCEPKRRYLQRGDQYVRLGLRAFQMFYDSMYKGIMKTHDEFDKSKFYTAFTKFGRYCLYTKVIDIESYTAWLIKHQMKLDEWSKDEVYAIWLKEYLRSENAEHAIKRSLNHMQQWTDSKQIPLKDYFREIHPNVFLHDIYSGRVSAWLILNSDSGLNALGKLTDEQLAYVNSMVDPQFWTIRFKRSPGDLTFAKEVVEVAQL